MLYQNFQRSQAVKNIEEETAFGFLTPEAVSVNISPEQAVLFVRTPILDARHFCTRILNHIKSTFLVDCCIAVTKPLSEYDSFKQAFSALEQQMEQLAQAKY